MRSEKGNVVGSASGVIGLPISVVSFFCGCGGLDLGFLGGFRYGKHTYAKLPFEIVAAYDNDPLCLETYRSYFRNSHAELADLTSQSMEGVPDADVLIGGFPCQDFSSCGPLHGLESSRGRMYEAMMRYEEVHRPAVVVAENVVNLERMRGGQVFRTILNDLSLEGAYRFNVWRLYAPDYGVPQRRTRLFAVGVRSDIVGRPHQPRTRYGKPYRSIEWAINDLLDVQDETVANQSQYFRATKAKKGNGQGDETNKRQEPAYTVRANAKSRIQFHYILDRRLTVRECARIQTFPDDFRFPHSATRNIMQIGNAVPPLLAYQVAREVARFLRPDKDT